jgi:Arc/MetJ-type ribon-helix-helix transcriptional regulator
VKGGLASQSLVMNAPDMKTITFHCPDELAAALDRLIEAGWEDSADAAIAEALRRYLRLRQPEVLEKHLEADIAWGLHGRE